ncbi:MAG: regulatory protein RecX [Spirochaetaceae bacterium]|nr:regulatory protein RecX [Spirochaetaceae bacterium]MDT8297091.1 regulatory protein RecX [Spirochaetaceae bacterium]
MVSPEHERSSNSPNARVSELKREGADGSVLRVHLDDGSLFVFSDDHPAAEIVLSLRDSPDPIDESVIERMAEAAEMYACRRKALDLLARAEQCRKGLYSKLTRKGFSQFAINQAVDSLETAGLLDDRRFAEVWARARLRIRPEGPSKLIGTLMSKGVSGSTAGKAVETVFQEAGEDAVDDALERALTKLTRRTGMDEKKLISALMRRGFPFSAIREHLMQHNRRDEID